MIILESSQRILKNVAKKYTTKSTECAEGLIVNLIMVSMTHLASMPIKTSEYGCKDSRIMYLLIYLLTY